ncbi:MAG: Smr/MutS family protein [Gemmatimonadales bacterium]|nr:Smr/MutS family protein [Gemmatimonadales bacterium]
MTVHEAGPIGVPSHGGSGTPLPLNPATSADALAALEFQAVLEVVAGHAAGPLGAAQLRARQPTADLGWIRWELALVGEVLAVLRRGDRLEVPPVPELKGALGRLRMEGSVLEISELAAVKVTLAAGRAVAQELERLAESCPKVAALRAPPADRTVERLLELAVGDDGDLLDTASPALAAARREVHAARERLVRRLESLLRDLDPAAVPGGATVTMRAGRYVIPVRRDARSRPEGIIHDESGSAGTLFLEPSAAIELGNAVRAAIIAEERETLRVLRDLTEQLRPLRDTIAALHAVAVEVDTILARARWARDCNGEVPTVGEVGTPLRLLGARHPLLLARGIKVVPFDLVLDGNERTLLISGPNTGGKTVLLKATGLMLALTQAGIVPPIGAECVLPIVQRLFVDIGDHQSLAADLSTFSAHVAELRRILDASDAGTIVILDEVGSGTDPAEGGALAMAVLETLTRRGVLTLATTHLGALKDLATRVPGVVNGSLQFDAATLSPTYRFTKGIPGRSYGLAIARRLGVDPVVLAAAEALVPEAERDLDRLLAQVEAREQALRAEEAAVRERAGDVERREAVAAMTAELQAAREAELKRQEKEAERERAKQAKAYLLQARKLVEDALALAKGAVDEASAREARRLVEEGVRSESRRLEERDALEPAGTGAIAPGRRVRLSTGTVGEVAEVRSDGKVVVMVGTMRLVVTAASLTPLNAADAGPKAKPMLRPVDEPTRESATELDLRGMRADEAEAVVLGAIDGAVLAEHPQLAIIHGMGTGALRDMVRRLLKHDKRVASFDFAPRTQGGTGVTIAVLR